MSLSTHTLTTLYAQRQRSNPYPLTNVPVTINDSGYENDDFTPKLNSTNSGVSWSKTTASGTTILLESDGARPNFKLRISTATGSQQWSFKWDGFDRVTDVTSIDTTGDGENLFLLSMGSSGWVKGTSAASGTIIAPPDISLSQSGNTATFNLPNGLADGYYDVVIASDGVSTPPARTSTRTRRRWAARTTATPSSATAATPTMTASSTVAISRSSMPTFGTRTQAGSPKATSTTTA